MRRARRSTGEIHRGATAAAIAAIALILTAMPATALTPVKVVGGAGDQYWPSSNGTYLAWTDPGKSSVYVRELSSGTTKRVNPRGTGGEQGSFVGASNVLVYDQWRKGVQGDIYFYDVATGARTKAPAAVNRAATWEWAPMASDNYLLFMRHKWSSTGKLLDRRLLLFDRHTGTLRTLETGVSRYFRPAFVGLTYVMWVTWEGTGKIHYWSEADGERIQLTTLAGHNQYAPFLDEASGALYFVRSRSWCGREVTIRRGVLGSAASTVLASLPRGIDTGEVSSVAANSGTAQLDLYFQRWSCRAEVGDIYALQGVDTI